MRRQGLAALGDGGGRSVPAAAGVCRRRQARWQFGRFGRAVWVIRVFRCGACLTGVHATAQNYPDGAVFDSSYSRGAPSTFAPNQVIKGWTEAMQLMSEGDKWELYIPSEVPRAIHHSASLAPLWRHASCSCASSCSLNVSAVVSKHVSRTPWPLPPFRSSPTETTAGRPLSAVATC